MVINENLFDVMTPENNNLKRVCHSMAAVGVIFSYLCIKCLGHFKWILFAEFSVNISFIF